MPTYLALLRGINVGGNNIIRMADLKACFERMGFAGVATYIQSGNVVFRSPNKSASRLAASIERALSERFAYTATVVVVPHAELRSVVRGAPKGFGSSAATHRYDVLFLKPPLTPRAALKQVRVREGVDAAHAGKRVLYFSRLIARATQSYLPKLVSMSVYACMTIRNWNTTTKLLALMDGLPPAGSGGASARKTRRTKALRKRA